MAIVLDPARPPGRRPARRHIPHPAGRNILLTGGSGVVGQALLANLSGSTTWCLVHRQPIDASGVVSLLGDIAQPRLGLGTGAFKSLARRIDGIVHSAAITNFNLPEELVQETNVRGTEHVLELAAAARVPLYHVSTAFVEPTSHSSQAPNAYERSKRASEQLVRSSGLPHVIVRPSLVVGDSRTGEISQFQGIYQMMGLFLRGLLPVIPADAESYADFIPRDVVANAIASLIERQVVSGEYWLTAGERALRLADVASLCTKHAVRLVGRPIEPPRLVSPEVFDRLIAPAFLPALPGRLQRMLERALQVSRYFNLAERFPSSLPEFERKLGVPQFADLRLVLLRSLDYWAEETRFGAAYRDSDVAPLAAGGLGS